jgi:pimeloyl-ACP methyl ester carboxylesterase
MAVVPVNARENGLEGEDRLLAALDNPLLSGAVTIMIHGYRFCPFGPPEHSPHRHILSLAPERECWKAISWPKHLNLDRPEALGIALGWSARGMLGTAYHQAERTGGSLAHVARIIASRRPKLPVHVVAHSLGARVVLAALRQLPAGALSHIILLSGAEYRNYARQVSTTAAGCTARILNVRSRENLPFDAAFRSLVRPSSWTDLPLSAGMDGRQSNWVDLSIDCPRHRSQLLEAGFRLRQPNTRFCHWSGYMRPGVFRLYRAFLSEAGPALFTELRDRLSPDPVQPAGKSRRNEPGFRATA